MAFDLIFEEPPSEGEGAAKGVSQTFVSDLPKDYKVFLLYFRGAMGDDDLEDQLKSLGEQTGHNMLVNFCSAGDSGYTMIVKRFGIQKFPTIIMTAVPDLAGAGDEFLTTFVRLDNSHLLNSPERTIQCVEELFQLFMQGEVVKAASKAKWNQRGEAANAIASAVGNAFKAIGKALAGVELSYSAVEGKFALKFSGE